MDTPTLKRCVNVAAKAAMLVMLSMTLIGASPAFELAPAKRNTSTAPIMLQGDGSPAIVDLYSNMPPNFAGLSGSGAIFSMGCISVGCPRLPPNAAGRPYDSQRAQFFLHTTTQADSRQQEYSAYIHMDANSGIAPFWKPNTKYVAGSQVTNDHQYQNAGDCRSGTDKGPSTFATSNLDGTCDWRFIGEGTNGKTALGVSIVSGPKSGGAWGMAINAVREPGGDLSRFTTAMELDASILDGDHAPGTPTGDAYGMTVGGVATNGSGTVAEAIGGGLPPQAAELRISAGSDNAQLRSAYGIYLNQLIKAPGVPADTYVKAINGLTITLSRNATASGFVDASFVNYMWHCGVCIISAYAVKDTGFGNGSPDNVGFLNNANSNGSAGFQDSSGGTIIGFNAAGSYAAAAFDTTAAKTAFAFRAIRNQRICLNVNDNCFYSYNDGNTYFDVGPNHALFIDRTANLHVGGVVRSVSSKPSVANCGTRAAIAGNSQSGIVTIGLGRVTSCTILLARAMPTAFAGCTLTPANSIATQPAVGAYAPLEDRTSTSWTIRGRALANAAFNYVCM